MTQKPSITRTLGQIHFEDLEPHRFEDLVRQLVYDYRDWQTIEATGRGGADDGYDIRAYEKQPAAAQDSDEETTEPLPPMEGRQWMIQCKREKEIGASKVKKIIAEGVDPNHPPYGYILAAAANISKKTYDAFRQVLREAGVMEFYLWGKAELEDLLLLPKNDRILFTFFGISMVSKRQSRTTQLRSRIATKNKLIGLMGESAVFYQDVLVRDITDEYYPFAESAPDFDTRPGWRKYTAFEHHPWGIWCHVHEFFGYINLEKKEYDYVGRYDFVFEDEPDEEIREQRFLQQQLIRKHWEMLAKHQQVHIKTEGLLKFEDMALIDPKGDTEYQMPHIFIDYRGRNLPFARLVDVADLFGEEQVLNDFKRVSHFKDSFEDFSLGKQHPALSIDLPQSVVNEYMTSHAVPALYSTDNRYSELKSRDVVFLPSTSDKEKTRWMVTIVYRCSLSEHMANYPRLYQLKGTVEAQIGKAVSEQAKINIYELKRIYDWELDP